MNINDSKPSQHFHPIPLGGAANLSAETMSSLPFSERLLKYRSELPGGKSTIYGIPFENDGQFIHAKDAVLTLDPGDAKHGKFYVFLHTTDERKPDIDPDGFLRPYRGNQTMGEHVADYVFVYQDGTRHAIPVRRRLEINDIRQGWGEAPMLGVHSVKPRAVPDLTGAMYSKVGEQIAWGGSQTRVMTYNDSNIDFTVYPAENPHPDKPLAAIEIRPADADLFIFGVSATDMPVSPIRWRSRRKARIKLKEGTFREQWQAFTTVNPRIGMDLGAIISVTPVAEYKNGEWAGSHVNIPPQFLNNEVIVEYAANDAAVMTIDEERVPVCDLEAGKVVESARIRAISVNPSDVDVTVKVVHKRTGAGVAAKIHVHGQHGEYLAPKNRARLPNVYWYEDWSMDAADGDNSGWHFSTYIDGKAEFLLPKGDIYVEITKGFEIQPIRKVLTVNADTRELVVEIDEVLPWRKRGWITADTHVHFVSPDTALYEGAGEGVNVVNLLASQWGELFTNIGDFDGQTTHKHVKEDTYVRVGTENRQSLLGHISLLGYDGDMILPLTTGGPDESAIGDAVELSLTQWAEMCQRQNGVVVLPHFPNPRAENAASIISGNVDGVELCGGINPYSLSDWYRYLNCGYFVAAVGGTDKMSAATRIGHMRTYSNIGDQPAGYDAWKASIRAGTTFATTGPLVEFFVDGQEPGARIALGAGGGTLDVTWEAASLLIPMTRVEIVVDGITYFEQAIEPGTQSRSGSCGVKIEKSGWVALRVRGQYPGRDEQIVAHTSPVMVIVDGKPAFNTADAMSILDQLEGSSAFIKSLGTKADQAKYQKLLDTVTGMHRRLHNRMHAEGVFHEHTPDEAHHHK